MDGTEIYGVKGDISPHCELTLTIIIEPKYIRGCVFSEQEYVDKYKKAYPNLKFISNSNSQGLFGKREWTTIGY